MFRGSDQNVKWFTVKVRNVEAQGNWMIMNAGRKLTSGVVYRSLMTGCTF